MIENLDKMRYTHFKAKISNAQSALRDAHLMPTIASMKTGEKIRKIRKARGLTLAEVENLAGISNGNLSRIERGDQWVSEEVLFALARVLEVPVADFFIQGDNFRNATPHQSLPLISWVQAGDWCEAIDNFQPGDAEEWIACPFRAGPRAYVLRVVGTSMFNPSGEKSYQPGDYIAVDPDRAPTNKSMVIARLDDENTATFKQLIIEPNGQQFLQALNPAWPDRIISVNSRASICGVVIGKWVPE